MLTRLFGLESRISTAGDEERVVEPIDRAVVKDHAHKNPNFEVLSRFSRSQEQFTRNLTANALETSNFRRIRPITNALRAQPLQHSVDPLGSSLFSVSRELCNSFRSSSIEGSSTRLFCSSFGAFGPLASCTLPMMVESLGVGRKPVADSSILRSLCPLSVSAICTVFLVIRG